MPKLAEGPSAAATPEQVEAAARAMFELEYRSLGSDWVIPEWDESQRSYWTPLAKAALLTAAEVGGPTLTNLPPEEQREAHKWMDHQLVAATIERCVQELDRLRQHEFSEADLFATGFNEAIKQAQFRLRALKDQT